MRPLEKGCTAQLPLQLGMTCDRALANANGINLEVCVNFQRVFLKEEIVLCYSFLPFCWLG